jgi:hypothetical protein
MLLLCVSLTTIATDPGATWDVDKALRLDVSKKQAQIVVDLQRSGRNGEREGGGHSGSDHVAANRAHVWVYNNRLSGWACARDKSGYVSGTIVKIVRGNHSGSYFKITGEKKNGDGKQRFIGSYDDDFEKEGELRIDEFEHSTDEGLIWFCKSTESAFSVGRIQELHVVGGYCETKCDTVAGGNKKLLTMTKTLEHQLATKKVAPDDIIITHDSEDVAWAQQSTYANWELVLNHYQASVVMSTEPNCNTNCPSFPGADDIFKKECDAKPEIYGIVKSCYPNSGIIVGRASKLLQLLKRIIGKHTRSPASALRLLARI